MDPTCVCWGSRSRSQSARLHSHLSAFISPPPLLFCFTPLKKEKKIISLKRLRWTLECMYVCVCGVCACVCVYMQQPELGLVTRAERSRRQAKAGGDGPQRALWPITALCPKLEAGSGGIYGDVEGWIGEGGGGGKWVREWWRRRRRRRWCGRVLLSLPPRFSPPNQPLRPEPLTRTETDFGVIRQN